MPSLWRISGCAFTSKWLGLKLDQGPLQQSRVVIQGPHPRSSSRACSGQCLCPFLDSQSSYDGQVSRFYLCIWLSPAQQPSDGVFSRLRKPFRGPFTLLKAHRHSFCLPLDPTTSHSFVCPADFLWIFSTRSLNRSILHPVP